MLRTVLPLNGFLVLLAFVLGQFEVVASVGRDAAHSAVPDSFYVEELILPGVLNTPTALAFTPGGSILIGEQSGVIWLWKDGAASLQLLWDLSQEVYANGARGLESMAVGSGANGQLYLFLLYTVSDVEDDTDSGAFGRITRYTFDPSETALLTDSRTVLLGEGFEDGIPACTPSHRTGELRLGNDGALLVATSDAAEHNQFDRGGMHDACFGPGRIDDGEDIGAFRAQSLTSLAGKILRLDPETGLGLASNPFFSGAGSNTVSKLWAYGFREPVGLTPLSDVHQEDHPGHFIVGDRGWNVLEELNRIQNGGGNYGWPCADGRLEAEQYADDPLAEVFCTSAVVREWPHRWWHHQNPSFSNPPGISATRLAGITRYTGTTYPSSYNGRIFYADAVRGWMASISSLDGADQEVFSLNIGSIHDLQFNPHDEYLYFIERGRKTVSRIRHERDRQVVALNRINQGIETAGNGLLGTYFDDADFAGNTVTRIDTNFVYDLFEGPEGDIYNAVQWEGLLVPEYSENYTLYLNTRGNSQLWLNNVLLVDYSDQDNEVSERQVQVTVALNAGEKYWIQINQFTEDDEVKTGLEWSSRSVPREPVSSSYLFYRFRERINLCRIDNATVSMSSTLSSFAGAGNACDGNTNGDFFEGSVAVTQQEDNPFWQVDIGEIRDIKEVTIWPRTDCCTNALNGAFVMLSDTPFMSNDLTVLSQAGVSAYIVNNLDEGFYTIPVNRTARYVRIQHPTQAELFLAEVEITAGIGNEVGAPPVEGLVAWWPFEDGLTDRRGNNNGILQNGARIVPDDQRQFVLELDGGSPRAEVPHTDVLNGTVALTYAAWIKPAKWEDGAVLLSKSSNTAGQVQLSVQGGELVGDIQGREDEVRVRAALPVVDLWSHVALVYSGNRLQLYVNGALQDETALGYSSLALNGSPFEMGGRSDGQGVSFQGRMDDVVIYNTALQPSELAELIGAASNVSIEASPDPGHQPDQTVSVEALYPNPFGEKLTIQFQLSEAQFARCVLYDGLGRLVRVLDEGHFSAGLHTLNWAGTGDHGQRMPAGTYFVRIEAGGGTTAIPVIRL